jgi:hypothetical protein
MLAQWSFGVRRVINKKELQLRPRKLRERRLKSEKFCTKMPGLTNEQPPLPSAENIGDVYIIPDYSTHSGQLN